LVEGPAKRQPNWLAGKSAQFKTVVFAPGDARPGQLARVRVDGATSHTLRGTQLG
jgi:tRNA A37 methylthiotransferase MiaB